MVDHDDDSYSLAATIYLIRLPLSRKHKLFQAEDNSSLNLVVFKLYTTFFFKDLFV